MKASSVWPADGVLRPMAGVKKKEPSAGKLSTTAGRIRVPLPYINTFVT